MNTTEAIILAGGLGNRLRSVVADVPKPMADIAGRPFLEYLLDLLAAAGVTRAILAVSYKRELIKSHLRNRYDSGYGPIDLVYSDETERRGTGGAILQALEQAQSDHVLVLNGDTLFAIDFSQLANAHHANHADLTVALRVMPDCERYGTVQTDQDTSRIIGFLEKQARSAGTINGGIYMVRREWMMQRTWPTVFSFEKDVLEALYRESRCFGVPFDAYFIDIGIPDDYQRANRELP
ncbi:MAG: nucleotidyltransferase family protein, partial [Phycisphaerae bacterium]|nr:nucleotidyltransferase family protein [Phycisphaerae bacterium]